ncbi:hypothetical protein EON62_06460 [archaeon]|nr:MAG: hypothetical protein EON62_06460 [archaeon]
MNMDDVAADVMHSVVSGDNAGSGVHESCWKVKLPSVMHEVCTKDSDDIVLRPLYCYAGTPPTPVATIRGAQLAAVHATAERASHTRALTNAHTYARVYCR